MDMNKNKESHKLYERALQVSPGGVHSPVRAFKGVGGEPLFFKSACGAYLNSVDGKSYIDFCQSFGPNILGHRDPDVSEAVDRALKDAWTFGACDPYSLELSEWITNHVDCAEKIRFVCSGTEAVMSALRIARAATKRNLILKFEGCYHGHADSMLVKAGSGLAELASSDSAGVSEKVASETIVCALDNESSVEEAFKKHGTEIAAVILEPLPANFGLLIQRNEFIKFVCDTAKKHGSLVIFDEVISGFRVAPGGMAEVLGIQPDLVTYGKIIGGGFPVGAYAGRRDLMDMVAPTGPVYQAGTLAANPIGARAGLATLRKLKEKNVYQDLESRSKQFADNLNTHFKENDLNFEMPRVGSLFWLHPSVGEVVRSPESFHKNSKEFYKKIFHSCLEDGVYLAPSAFEVGFLCHAHSEEDLKKASDAIKKAVLSAVKENHV